MNALIVLMVHGRHFTRLCHMFDVKLVILGSMYQVGDFGLSKIKRNTLVSGGVRGTLPWMAPELLNGSSNKVSEKVSCHHVYFHEETDVEGTWRSLFS